MHKSSRPKTFDSESEPEPRSQGSKKKPKRGTRKLRIIGGSMRGRTVVYHGAEFTRPMKDSVRESLFNILGPRVKGANVIDLFAGTGAVAFEAISRGAAKAVAIERHRLAARFLLSTAKTLEVDQKFQMLIGDSFRLGPKLLGPVDIDQPHAETPWIVFWCPPYQMWESETESLHQLIRLGAKNCPPQSILVAETDKHQSTEVLPEGRWDHRTYGGTRLSFLEPELVCGMGDFTP
ncbi:MAG: RsmD family RNA methyltransferase [Planctomycetota bacterium]